MQWCSGEEVRPEEDAGELFKTAFGKRRSVPEQIRILQEVLSKHPRSKWADDALWIVGERFTRAKQYRSALHFRLRLWKEYPACRLEPFSTRQRIYRASRVPGIKLIFDRSGHIGTVSQRRVLKPMNVVPITVAEDIALLYRRCGESRKAARWYRVVLAKCPAEGIYRELIEKNLRELDETFVDR